MSKPREFAHLIRNKFGSADNINNLSRNGDNATPGSIQTGHATAEEAYSANIATTLSAGNSNSLPGHGSQVFRHLFPFVRI